MAFVKVDTDNGDSRFTSKLVSALNHLDSLYALLNEIDGEMQNMTTAQVEQYYGLAAYADIVKGYVNDAVGVLETDDALLKLRTQMG